MEKASKKQLKLVRELLRDKAARDYNNMFVAEGEKIVKDMVSSDKTVLEVFVSNDFLKNEDKFVADLQAQEFSVYFASNSDIEKISSLKNSQGVLAVMFKLKKNSIEDNENDDDVIVLCDGVQDPGNLGAIIRSALAFEVGTMICTKDTVDPYNPKVVRASSGGVAEMIFYDYSKDLIHALKNRNFKLAVSSVKEAGILETSDVKNIDLPVIVAFGNEGKGVSGEILNESDFLFHIPVSKKVESLNVSAACAVTLYELNRGK